MKNQNFARRLSFAWRGILCAARTERSLRTQLVALCVVVIVLLMTRPEAVWWAALLLSATGVLVAELANTAIEALADRFLPSPIR